MAATLRLTVLTGPHKNKRFCVREHSACLIGRAPDCAVQLSGEERDRLISRHHCQLSLDPSCVRLADLGSVNGTYLNGRNIRKLTESVAELLANVQDGSVRVNDGDIITIGGTSLRADIILDCPPPDSSPDAPWANGELVMKDCPALC